MLPTMYSSGVTLLLYLVHGVHPFFPGHRNSATVSPASIGSDVEIVYQNDLQGASTKSNHAVILLSNKLSYSEAADACGGFNEGLVNPGVNIPLANLTALLEQSNVSSSQYLWISSVPPVYRAINSAGAIAAVSATARLPALCTNTAPYSNKTYADSSSNWQVKVSAANQTITGFRDRISFRFLGVRYAAQPQRFTYSQPYTAQETYSALSPGSECLQVPNAGSEDCLFLNIFTPYLPESDSSSELKPVLFYIHGGAFIVGAGSLSEYDGGNLAARGDIVVVTINYRLGPFGFLALNDGSTNGNYGIADQIAALDWIRANIAAFGGDPTRIVIAGQSAGAMSVKILLASPKAAGKFAAAMPMSDLGGIGPFSVYEDRPSIIETAAIVGEPLLQATGCANASSPVQCLQSLSASSILYAGTSPGFPCVDGTYITSSDIVLDGSGNVANVHVLTGNMRDEAGALISVANTTNVTESIQDSGFNSTLYTLNSNLFPTALGPNATLDAFNVTVHFATDAVGRCVSQAFAYDGAVNGVFKSVWYYEYERSYQVADFDINAPLCDAPITTSHPYGDPSQPYFRCHGGDVYYVFGNLAREGRGFRDSIDLPFSQFIVDLLSSFVRTYNPNPSSAFLKSRNFISTLDQIEGTNGIWQPVSSSGNPLRRLDWPSNQAAFNERPQCDALGLLLNYYG